MFSFQYNFIHYATRALLPILWEATLRYCEWLKLASNWNIAWGLTTYKIMVSISTFMFNIPPSFHGHVTSIKEFLFIQLLLFWKIIYIFKCLALNQSIRLIFVRFKSAWLILPNGVSWCSLASLFALFAPPWCSLIERVAMWCQKTLEIFLQMPLWQVTS